MAGRESTWMRWQLLLVVVTAGCGRLGFPSMGATGDGGGGDGSGLLDAGVGEDVAAALPLCLEDTFDDNDVSDWLNLNGQWTITPGGPDGSLMLHNDVVAPMGATHPMLRAVHRARVSVDMRIESAAAGDFDLIFLAQGSTNPDSDSQYRVGIFPSGSDAPTDNVRRIVTPMSTFLTQRPTSLQANTWYRVEVLFEADHSMNVSIDGASHMTSAADTGLAGPFDIVFDFYQVGAIDNVRVLCD